MKKEVKELKKDKSTERLKLVVTGSLLFFAITVITFAVILYSAYFFTISFLKIAFRIIIALIGILTYYLLILEFISYYSKKIS